MYAPYRESRTHIVLIVVASVLAAVSIVLALINLSFYKTSYMSYGVFLQTIEDILITCLLAVVIVVQVLIIRQLYQRRPQPTYVQPVTQPYAPYPQPAHYRPTAPLTSPPRMQPPQPQPPPPQMQPVQPQYPRPQVQPPMLEERPEVAEEHHPSYAPQIPRTPESVLRPPPLQPSQPSQPQAQTRGVQKPVTRPLFQKPTEREESKEEG
ncbi:MAG: hypothetical protein GXO23_00320 [Crenarchaeota archaeon]|nr:hypothetical protein [Thermoproteota archaeon]